MLRRIHQNKVGLAGTSSTFFVAVVVIMQFCTPMVSAQTQDCTKVNITPVTPKNIDCATEYEDYSQWDPFDSICNNGGAAATTSSTTGSTTSGTSGGSYTLDQVKTFASEPITSTWNISDSTVEQWFLKQAGAQATIAKYGLNSSNIGNITAAVKQANVSPVFFYLYTVNEGGGAGGFINHYSGDVPGGGPANATRDAKYLVTQAQQKGTPATGGGEPSNMPTAEAQQILNALPLGSIGVVYIQATSAVTAELEDLSGKTGGWTGLFGKPLSAAMANIQSMGGNPMQGGTSVSGGCTAVTGQGMAQAVNWAIMIAKNNGYGYDQPTRTSGWAKYQSDPSCSTQCGSFDCSSFVAAALTEAGYFRTNPEFNTTSEASYLSQAGFKNVTSSVSLDTGANMQPGDILLNTADHTAMYIGNGQLVQASINENGGVSGGQVGDQTGTEIYVRSYYNFPWDSVWRASN
jgi:cell wall-associated NlpC family hydrolase